MAKLKPAGKKKAPAKRPGGLISCIFLIVMGIVLMTLLFYVLLRSAAES